MTTKKILLFAACSIVLLISILFAVLSSSNNNKSGQASPKPSRSAQTNEIVSVNPPDDAGNVPIGSTVIFNFKRPVSDASLLQVQFSPELPNGRYDITSKIPSTNIVIKPLGYFALDTEYTVTIFYDKEPIYTFNFTTESETKAQTDPGAVQAGIEEALKLYPLGQVVPYNSENVYADYYAPKKLDVRVKKGTRENAIKELETWMRKNNIDPATHELNFLSE